MPSPLVTVGVPSLNQRAYLDDALRSLRRQAVSVEVVVADGGSSDGSVELLEAWDAELLDWWSRPDNGQSSAVNAAVARGTAPYVCWLNSDDRLLPGGLDCLVRELDRDQAAPAVYGKVWNERGNRLRPVRVEPFSESRLALHCIISQPGTLVRRSAWERVGGLREDLHMAMDYDLWWRLYRELGPLRHVDSFVAVNRDHPRTKTNLHRRRHYREAIEVVRRFHGSVPVKWWLFQPYSVWLRGFLGMVRR